MLTVALPKGRIAEETLELFETIFQEKFIFEERKLILKRDDFTFLLVRNQDVPAYVAHQAADIGVVGLDVITEQEADVVQLLDLHIGKCKVCVGIRNEERLDWNRPQMKVASKMVNITRNYFSKKAMGVEVIKLYGSIELAPLVGLADAIVDIVETGTTMKRNGLKVAETIMESSAHLIANNHSFLAKKSEIMALYRELEPIVRSRR